MSCPGTQTCCPVLEGMAPVHLQGPCSQSPAWGVGVLGRRETAGWMGPWPQRFSNFLGPWLNFLQHCTSIFIIIQLTGKGKIMGSFFPMAQKSETDLKSFLEAFIHIHLCSTRESWGWRSSHCRA